MAGAGDHERRITNLAAPGSYQLIPEKVQVYAGGEDDLDCLHDRWSALHSCPGQLFAGLDLVEL